MMIILTCLALWIAMNQEGRREEEEDIECVQRKVKKKTNVNEDDSERGSAAFTREKGK